MALTELGLIDEYRIIVSPLVLGSGKALFKGFNYRLKLHLLETRMTLRHIGIPPGTMRDMCEAGWNESFDKLAACLG